MLGPVYGLSAISRANKVLEAKVYDIKITRQHFLLIPDYKKCSAAFYSPSSSEIFFLTSSTYILVWLSGKSMDIA